MFRGRFEGTSACLSIWYELPDVKHEDPAQSRAKLPSSLAQEDFGFGQGTRGQTLGIKPRRIAPNGVQDDYAVELQGLIAKFRTKSERGPDEALLL